MKRICFTLWLIVGTMFIAKAQNSIATLSLRNITETRIQQNPVIQNDTVITLNYPESITGLSVSGSATLNHDSNSLVRITLQDDYNTEWLVYELFPLLADSSTVSFNNVAFESSVLDNVTAKRLNIKIINASLHLDEVNTTNQRVSEFATRQSKALQSQSAYIIDKLNENLEKREMLWRAGETSISQMTYEEKKAMFGGEVPNLGGFEYYKGGIFVMPGYEGNNNRMTTASTTDDDPYVKEWDWRNRHGKNWMTPVKDQGLCGSCGAFSTIGVLEAYVNLYYNKLINLDLSEQELVSCLDKSEYTTDSADLAACGKIVPYYALKYIKENGIVNEDCFRYTGSVDDCNNKCSTPTEKLYITNYTNSFNPKSKNELKDALFESPMIVDINTWEHSMVLVGYKIIQENDTIWYTNNAGNRTFLIASSGSPYIGSETWIFKNSWGDSYFDYNGYYYVISDINDFRNCLKIKGKIISLNYTDNDIAIVDNDDDGYYTWGLGERPISLPDWVPEEQDGDDSNDRYGYINEYGYLQDLTVTMNREIYGDMYPVSQLLNYGLIIKNNANLILQNNTITMNKNADIIVESGGTITIDGGGINKANLILKSGANLIIKNGGQITLRSNDSFVAEIGSTVLIENGTVNTN